MNVSFIKRMFGLTMRRVQLLNVDTLL